MSEKTTKRRQGQTKADGTKATPKPLCPKCGEILKRNYTQESIDGKRRFVKAGWTCPNTTCDYTIKDLVELKEEEEETAEGTDKAEKIKKLTEEFMKTHDRLNELAEQIKELETE